MENIILTNNKDLRLVGVKVGVYSTLRFELPLVPESATHVEVIVTSGGVHSAYTATFVPDTKSWQCDIAASQFPTVGKQSYEVAYVLDGKQFWDGKGWIEIEDATTSGIEPQPRPEPYRYTVLSVNGYGADAQGAVRIPKTFIATDSPATTEGYMEGDIYFNRLTGAAWTLCNVQDTLTWVFDYSNYYTKAETDEAIDKLAAYYITYNAAGAAFPTRADLLNAQTYYSGGVARVPTRNDYAVVLADEAHGGAEWRYIYAVADGQTTGQWEAQYPIETNDYTGLANKPQINGNTLTSNKTGAALGLLDTSAVVAPSTDSSASGKAADAKATGDALADKQSALSAQQLANIAAVSDALVFDATHSYAAGDPVVYDGTLYTFTAAHTGAWTGSDVSAVDVIARLAGKLDKSGDQTLNGNLTVYTSISDIAVYGGSSIQHLSSGTAKQFTFPDKSGTFALTAGTGHAGNLAALDASGNPTDALIPAANVATKAEVADATNTANAAINVAANALNSANTADNKANAADVKANQALATIPYDLGTPIVIDEASTEVVEGETVNYGAATLANRTANIVQVTAATALNELRITFPAATSGKVRDFGLRVEIGTGSAALAAPALVPVAPTGETIKIESADGTIPALADGTATAKGVTLLYFSETAPGVFVVKGEQVEEMA